MTKDLFRLDYLAGPTGGFWYHWAALEHRASLWKPFLDDVESWLADDWAPREKELVIFGSSAGWSLTAKFLERFERVICVEPDPLARFLFRRRFGKRTARIDFVSDASLLPWFSNDPEAFARFLSKHAGAAVLFSNLLGQILLLIESSRDTNEELEKARGSFRKALAGRSWASYHDVISSRTAPLETLPRRMEKIESVSDLSIRAFPDGAQIVDHDTLWLSQGRPTRFSTWQIRPERYHVVGFVHSRE